MFAAEERLSLPRFLEKSVRVLSSLKPDFEEGLLRPLTQTQDRILALQYSLSNKSAIAALQERASRGVPVELVLDPSTLATARYHAVGSVIVLEGTRGLNPGVRDLINHEGVNVRVYDGGRGLMHCKTFIMQGVNTGQGKMDVVHSGSANCTGVGMDGTNCEISHIFTDPDIVAEYLEIYRAVRESSRPIIFGERRAELERKRKEDPFLVKPGSRKNMKRKKKEQRTVRCNEE